MEDVLGVPRTEQLENTNQKLLPYLFHYGTDDTVSALPGFYGVSICGLSDHHLVIERCPKARRVAYQCLMCAEANFSQNILVAGCEHYFHPVCLANWLSTTTNSAGRCPQCSAESMNELSHLMNDPKALAPELLAASQNGNRQLVEMLLRLGANVGIDDQNGDTALHWAARQGDEDMVRQLLFYQSDMQRRNIWGKTAGDLARERSHNAVLRLLGEEPVPEPSTGLRVADSPDDIEALQRAVQNGQKSDVIELLKKGMDVHQRFDNGDTLLHLAVNYGHGEVAQLLIDVYKLNPKATNKEGDNALHRAAFGGHIELVQRLIDHYKLNPEIAGQHGMNALHLAANGGHTGVVQRLIDQYRLDLKATGEDGRNVLHIATMSGHIRVVQLLIDQYHLAPEATDQYSSNSLHFAALGGNSELVRLLIDQYHVDSKARGQYGMNALHIAATGGHIRVVELLINDYHLDPNAVVGRCSRNALHMAAKGGHIKLVQLLINHIDPKVTDKKGTNALHLAAEFGHSELVRLLLEHIDPKVTDREGWNALHLAIRSGHCEVIRLLVGLHKLNFEAPGPCGANALHLAACGGHIEVVKLLIDHCHLNPGISG